MSCLIKHVVKWLLLGLLSLASRVDALSAQVDLKQGNCVCRYCLNSQPE